MKGRRSRGSSAVALLEAALSSSSAAASPPQQNARGQRQPTLFEIISRDFGFLSYFRWVLKYSSARLYSSSAAAQFCLLSSSTASLASSIPFCIKLPYLLAGTGTQPGSGHGAWNASAHGSQAGWHRGQVGAGTAGVGGTGGGCSGGQGPGMHSSSHGVASCCLSCPVALLGLPSRW